MAPLHQLLADMFAAAEKVGGSASYELPDGLHLKVATRGRRMVIAWREEGKQPSAKELEIVGEDAGFYDPDTRPWKCRESAHAFLIVEGFQGQLCEHEWGDWMHVNMRPKFLKTHTCKKCGVVVGMSYSTRKNSKDVYHYDTWELRETVFARWVKLGPVPGSLRLLPHHGKAGKAVQTTPAPPAPPTPTPTDPDAALKLHLINLLGVVSFAAACRNHWFRHHTVIEARRAYLKKAEVKELREEVESGWFRRAYRHALPYVLAACRWRHQYRALPVKATAGKRTRKPRQKKAEVAAA